ncbi:MAG: peptide transporter substrate-binding protein [Chloroflexi bacterium]|nr:peptide transporter substrate-binding protein [Chloroflexota bacterium]
MWGVTLTPTSALAKANDVGCAVPEIGRFKEVNVDEELSGLLRDYRSGRLSRRDFVQRGVAMGMTVSALGMILHNTGPVRAAMAHSVSGARKGGTLRVAVVPPSTPLDPALIGDVATILVGDNIYNFLVRLDHNLIPYPDLATKWSVSKDGLVWTFPLHKNVKFHSGKPFTADDVLFTVQRTLNPKTGSPVANLFAGISKMVKLDDYTVQFTLKAPNPDFPVNFADYHMCILENNFSGNFSTKPSGTGPFMLKEYVPADHATLVRNPSYFENGYPYLDAIKLVFLPDVSTQIAALKSGTVDAMTNVTPAQAQPLMNVSGITALPLGTTGFNNLRMRADKKPFNDPRVRMAFKLVTDRKAINAAVLRGVGTVGDDHPISPAYGEWYTNIGTRQLDIPKAKALLAQAGYPKGLSVTLTTQVAYGGSDFAVAFQQLAAAANINVNIVLDGGGSYFNTDWLTVPLGITSWGARPVPNTILQQLFVTGQPYNEAHYSNKHLDALIAAAGSELNPSKRKGLYKQIETLISEDGPSIIPIFTTFIFPFSNKVKGYQPIPNTFQYYKSVWLSA